jgi:hypothetical protein
VEEQILRKLSKLKEIDFQTFRADFPLTPEFKVSYDNLKDLKLISENGDYIQLSLNGIDAINRGLKNWTKEKVYSDIKNANFAITKDLPRLELQALNKLEHEGYVYNVGMRKYKLVPKMNYTIKPKEIETSDNSKYNSSKNNIITSVFKYIGWWIVLVVGLLAIIEYRFHYVSNFWERLLSI